MTHYVTVAPGFEGLLLDNGCIISTLSKTSSGYANKRLCIDGHWKTFSVPRLVLEHKLGRAIEPGYFACHTCDVRNCINPDHLWEGSRLDNSRDRFKKGRIKNVGQMSAPVPRKPEPGIEVIPGLLRGEIQPNGCIISTLAKRSDGYAVKCIKINGKNQSFYPHRLVLEYKLGRQIKPGYTACHTCDNRGCINPDHLWEGTYKQNTLDAAKKGRLSRKLDVEQVIEIKQRLAKGDLPKDIAPSFGMSHRNIVRIRNGDVWEHLQVEGFEPVPPRHRKKLTLEEVKEIRNYLAAGITRSQIAQMYAIGKTTVAANDRGESWRE